jgi:hypothetical protein
VRPFIGALSHIWGTMAFNIEVADTVRFAVKFNIKDGAGVDKPSSFDFIAARVDVDEYKDILEGGTTFADFLVRVGRGWDNVRDGNGTPVEYSEAALRKVCKIAGMATLMFKTYGVEVSAKEKN